MNEVLLIVALFAEGAAVASLKFSHGLSKRLPALAMSLFAVISLTLLSFALNVKGFEMSMVYAAWAGVGIAFIAAIELFWKEREQWKDKGLGPIGTMARFGLGLGLVGSVVHGQLTTRVAPATWALGLVGFTALALACHWWRIRHHPAPFRDTGPLSFTLSVALPLALYFTWWYAPTLSVTSDAVLIFVGLSMMLAALRSYAGCEILASSNWLLGRSDQLACAIFTPLDSLEQRRLHEG